MDPSTKGREDNSPSSRPVHTQAARDENVSGSAELSHEFSYGTFVGDSPVVTGSRAMMYQDNSQIVDEGEMFQGREEEAWNPPVRMLGVVAWFMIAGTVACLAAIATNLDWWRDRGVDFILDAQDGMNTATQKWWENISALGEALPLTITMVVYLAVDYDVGVRMAMLLAWVTYVSACLKTVLHDCRPFWFSEDVRAIGGCSATWGLPSSHASASAAFFPFIVWEVYHVRKYWLPEQLVQARHRRMAYMLCIEGAAAVAVVMVGVSRMCLGQHFPYQVLVGWLVGLCTLLRFLAEAPSSKHQGRFASTADAPHARVLVFCILLAVALAMVPSVTYHVVKTRWGPPPVWTENAGEACGDSDWEVDQAGAMNEGVGAAAVCGVVSAVMHWHDSLYPFRTNQGTNGSRFIRGVLGVLMMFGAGFVADTLQSKDHHSEGFKAMATFCCGASLTILLLVGGPVICMATKLMEAPKPGESGLTSKERASLLPDPSAGVVQEKPSPSATVL